MDTLLNDLRFALRSLRRAPVFAAAAVLALGVGTGSTSAVFSLLDGVVLRPLPYGSPERLVSLWETNHQKGLEHEPISPVNFGDYRALPVFEDAAAWWRPQFNLADWTPADPIRVNAIEVSQNFFHVVGVKPNIGQGFGNAAKLYGGSAEIVISARLFASRFQGDRAALGRNVKLNGSDYTLVGVMPEGFGFPGSTDVWQALEWNLANHSRAAHFMESVARLKPGISLDQANVALATLATRLTAEFPGTNTGWSVRATALDREVAGVFRPALFALFGASGLLLLIACSNVANLLLARAAVREREVAVRGALGASRGQLVRLFLTESFVLAVLGSLLGFGFAVAAVKGLLAWTPINIPRAGEVGVNLTVLAFATVVTTLTALTFGLAPAFALARRSRLHESLKEGARGSGARARGRNALVVAEVTLAVILLAGSGLLIRSVSQLLRESAGVDPVSVVTADVSLPDAQYREWPVVERFYSTLLTSLRERPEVMAAGASNFLPLDPAWRMPLRRSDQPPPAAGEQTTVQHQSVDEGYFATVRARLVKGRFFEARDDAAAPGVVIVNEVLARQFWPGEDPIGKRVLTGATQIGPLGRRLVPSNELEVVGVVGDLKNTSLTSPAEPAVYFAERQFPFRKMNVVVRARGEPAGVASVLRQELRRLDPALAAPELQTMERVLAAASDPPRFVMLLMSVFAVLALTLAAVGIYGILNYAVSRRRREFAIRLALGAEPGKVLRQVLGEGLTLVVIGCVLGVTGAVLGGRLLGTFLYEVKPWDAPTLAGVLVLVLGVATAACLAPGRRAAGEDPARALREE